MYYVEIPAISSIIDVMKTWGESGFPARLLVPNTNPAVFPYGLPQSHPGFTRWLCAFHLGFSLVLQPQMVAWSVGAVLKIAMSSYGQRLCSQ